MITGFDHVVIAVNDIAAGAAAFETLLGARPSLQERDGIALASFATANLDVELMAPVGAGETADRLRASLQTGEGLKSLVFAARELENWRRRAERVGLAPEPISAGPGYRRFRLGRSETHGARLFCLERDGARPAESAAVSGVDHIVMATPEPERAAALYGARLGLDMRLDRVVMDRRLMFFRCGDAILEIVSDPSLSQDQLWGISWRVADADAARARLAAAGVEVSEVRAGMKPGTRVFTLREGACGTPTLMLEASARG